MPERRADLSDASLRDQGERLLRQDALARSVSLRWIEGIRDLAAFVIGRAAFIRFGRAFRLKRPDIQERIRPAREECERLVTAALIDEVRLTDESTRSLLRDAIPRVELGESEGDIPPPPAESAWQHRVRKVNEIGIRLGEPVFTDAETQRLVFAPFKGAKQLHAVRWTTRFRRLERETARTVLRQVQAAYSDGWSTDRLAREIEIETGKTEYEARRIARTELQRVGNKAKDECLRSFGDMLAGEKWQAAWEDTCMECGLLDGQVFPPGNAPIRPVHPQCACTISPVPRTWRELGVPIDEIEPPGRQLAGYKIMPKGMNWRTWIRKQPAAYQKRILGATRYAMIERGTLKMSHLRAPGGGVIPVKALTSVAD